MNFNKSRQLYVLGLVLVLNIGFFSLVNPVLASSPLLAAGFLLLSVDIYLLVRLLLLGLRLLRGRSISHEGRTAFAISATCVLLVALQSIGELSARDGIAMVLIAVIVMFYVSYYRPKPSR
jgi:hypothetical protein